MTTIEDRIRRLPEPEAPKDLAANVALHVAAIAAESAAPTTETKSAPARYPLRDRLAIAAALSGAAAVLTAQVYRLIAGESALDLIAPRTLGGLSSAIEQFPATPATAITVTALALYVAGWLLPVRDR